MLHCCTSDLKRRRYIADRHSVRGSVRHRDRLLTPVFHRWHHTSPSEGGNANFAPLFSAWDVLFGTFYMPAGKIPDHYGVDDPMFPQGFLGQLVYPFRHLFDFGARPDEIISPPPAP